MRVPSFPRVSRPVSEGRGVAPEGLGLRRAGSGARPEELSPAGELCLAKRASPADRCSFRSLEPPTKQQEPAASPKAPPLLWGASHFETTGNDHTKDHQASMLAPSLIRRLINHHDDPDPPPDRAANSLETPDDGPHCESQMLRLTSPPALWTLGGVLAEGGAERRDVDRAVFRADGGRRAAAWNTCDSARRSLRAPWLLRPSVPCCRQR